MSNVVYLSNPENSQYIQSPDSLAYQAIILKKSVFSSFTKQYEEGLTLKQMDFGIEFATSCAKYTVKKLAQYSNPEEHLEELISDFTIAVAEVKDTEFSEALLRLRYEILNSIPSFCIENENIKVIKMNISQQMALIILDNIYEEQLKYNIVVNIFSQYFQY